MMTTYRMEKQAACRRAEERRVRELLQYANESDKLSQAAQNEANLASLQQSNLLARIAAEEAAQRKKEHGAREALKALFLKEQHDILAQKVSRQNRERDRIEHEIQRICETSEELKELESKLKIAYINKERAAQHQEALLLKTVDAAREQVNEEKMEIDRQHLMAVEAQKEEKRRNDLVKQKAVLQQQMHNHQVRAMSKAMVDSV